MSAMKYIIQLYDNYFKCNNNTFLFLHRPEGCEKPRLR